MSEIRGFRRLAPFCPACQSRGTLHRGAGHGRPRKFVLQASPGSWESLARSPHGESRCKQGFGGAENVPQAGAWPSKPRGARRRPRFTSETLAQALPTKLAEKRTCASRRPQTACSTALVGFQAPATAAQGLPIVRVHASLAGEPKTRYTPRSRCRLRCRASHRSLHRLRRQLEQFCARCHRLHTQLQSC